MNDVLSVIAVLSVPIALIGLYAIFNMVLPASLSNDRRDQIRAVFMLVLSFAALKFHLHIDGDVIVDQRGAVLAVAALFGGAWVGVASAATEIICRTYIGGSAMWAGMLGIVTDLCGVMLVLFVARAVPDKRWGRVHLLAFLAVTVGISEAVSLLYIAPLEHGWILLQRNGLYLFVLQVLSVLLLGGLLHLEDTRIHALLQADKKREALRRTLHQVVESLSMAMVHRDPGTANHEQRVAELSVAVGKALGWDEDRLEGLYLAAMVHDIGQIQLPAEILKRPRKLNPAEFELVKMHAETGYRILRNVEFPWPIAETIYQHHENLDGSGYPRGLAGGQIIPEARIIRVCDALEAMLSHRPFRRAYALQEALAMLQAQRGVQFDENIVDICVRLLNEQGYSFSDVND